MKKMINKAQIIGRVYDHNLAIKTVQKEGPNFGKQFIGGSIDIATDDAGLNVVPVYFTYVTELTSKGQKNNTYGALKDIIDNNKTVVLVGADNAMKVKIDTAIAVNDFYSDNAKTDANPDGLVSAKRCEGGFVTIIPSIKEEEEKRNAFECDFLINNATLVEADPERHIDADFMKLKGVTFNFRGDIIPVDLLVKSEGGIKYFDSLNINSKNVVFTKVWGNIVNQTIVNKVEEETAFGTPSVREYTRTNREWIISGCAKEPYDLGDDTVLTAEELKKANENRQLTLAEVKSRQEAYQASKNAPVTATASTGGFMF